MSNSDWLIGIFGAVALVAAIVALRAVLVWILWPLVVPEVFIGSVAAGSLPASLSYGTAFKLMFLVGVFRANAASALDKKRDRA